MQPVANPFPIHWSGTHNSVAEKINIRFTFIESVIKWDTKLGNLVIYRNVVGARLGHVWGMVGAKTQIIWGKVGANEYKWQ